MEAHARMQAAARRPEEGPLVVARLAVQVSLTDAAGGATIHRQEVLEVRPRRADQR